MKSYMNLKIWEVLQDRLHRCKLSLMHWMIVDLEIYLVQGTLIRGAINDREMTEFWPVWFIFCAISTGKCHFLQLWLKTLAT